MQKFISTVSFLFVFSSLVFSRIESVKLIYDKKEVYVGNTFDVSLRTETHRGKVFLSKGHPRFDCQEFEYKISKGIEIVFLGQELFRVKVLDNFELDSFNIRLRYLYNSNKYYSFDLMIHDYVNEVEFLKVNPLNSKIFSNTEYDFSISAHLYDGLIINVNETGKITYKDIDFKVSKKGKKIEKFSVVIDDYDFCDSKIVINAYLKKNRAIYVTKKYKILPNSKLVQNFRTKKGRKGIDGIQVKTPTKLFMGGVIGKDGTNGRKGSQGGNGPSIMINIDLVFNECIKDSVLRIEFLNKDNNSILETKYISPNNQLLYANVNGGNGGEGGKGGVGETGYHGRYYLLSPSTSNAENGGDGGNGGSGADGGNGGDGGDVIVYYTKRAELYKNSIFIKSYGGKGGLGGRGGDSGRGGSVGNGGLGNASTGRSGLPGRDGRNGRDGRDGNVHYILIKE